MNPAVIDAIAHNITAFGTLIAAVGSVVVSWKVKKDTQELRPNHGSSLKDAMNRVEGKVENLATKVESTSDTLNLVVSDVSALRTDVAGVRSDVADERHERRELSKRAEEVHARLWNVVGGRSQVNLPKRRHRHQNR